MTRVLKYFLFLVVMALMALPLIESKMKLLPDNPLQGSFDIAPKPSFRIEDWKSGKFQLAFETYLNDNIGGREYFVRLRNQYYFSVFGIAMANGVAIAKNGVLLERGYIDAFYGKDFAGATYLEDKLRRWKRVERGLDSIGVKASLVLVPGKASYFEDDFSDEMIDEHQPITNYKFVADWAKTNEIRLLDIKKLYHTWMDTSQYRLYTNGGIHWSEYGVAHVCDTLRGYIQSITNRPLQKFWFDIELSLTPRGTDNDIGEGMNLLFPPIESGLAYPIRYFGTDSSIVPTKLLSIGDSYYWNIVFSGFGDRICSYGGFWYYFREAIPAEAFGTSNVEELDILKHIKDQDVLLLLITESQLNRFGWGAVEKLESVLYPPKELKAAS